MKCLIAIVTTSTVFLGLGAASAQAQNRKRSVSLGDLARQLKAQRAESEQMPRVFTNDDLVAQPTSGDQLASSPAALSSSGPQQAEPEEKPPEQTSANATSEEPAKVTQAETFQETPGDKHYRHGVSKPKARRDQGVKTAKISAAAVKPAKHSAPPVEHPLAGKDRQRLASARMREMAKANPLPARKAASRAGAPRQVTPPPRTSPSSAAPPQVAAVSSSSQPSVRQDLGYVEKADGKVEAIVAEGEFVGLVDETKAFAMNFHVPAPTPVYVETAGPVPLPTNSVSSVGPEAEPAYPSSSTGDAGGAPPAATEAEAALAPQPKPLAEENGEPKPEGFFALQPGPLADYASDQWHPKPPEALQAPPCPALPDLATGGGVTHSTVSAIGYVEKAGGEREAIVEVLGQIYLVHEGEAFAGNYRALRVTPTSVEIVEEPTEAASALPERGRNIKDVLPRVSK